MKPDPFFDDWSATLPHHLVEPVDECGRLAVLGHRGPERRRTPASTPAAGVIHWGPVATLMSGALLLMIAICQLIDEDLTALGL